jgi:hypothetical protein
MIGSSILCPVLQEATPSSRAMEVLIGSDELWHVPMARGVNPPEGGEESLRSQLSRKASLNVRTSFTLLVPSPNAMTVASWTQ